MKKNITKVDEEKEVAIVRSSASESDTSDTEMTCGDNDVFTSTQITDSSSGKFKPKEELIQEQAKKSITMRETGSKFALNCIRQKKTSPVFYC